MLDRDQASLAQRFDVTAVGPFWALGAGDGRAPPRQAASRRSRSASESRGPRLVPRLGTEPEREIVPDPFLTWELRTHFGQPAEPPAAPPETLERSGSRTTWRWPRATARAAAIFAEISAGARADQGAVRRRHRSCSGRRSTRAPARSSRSSCAQGPAASDVVLAVRSRVVERPAVRDDGGPGRPRGRTADGDLAAALEGGLPLCRSGADPEAARDGGVLGVPDGTRARPRAEARGSRRRVGGRGPAAAMSGHAPLSPWTRPRVPVFTFGHELSPNRVGSDPRARGGLRRTSASRPVAGAARVGRADRLDVPGAEDLGPPEPKPAAPPPDAQAPAAATPVEAAPPRPASSRPDGNVRPGQATATGTLGGDISESQVRDVVEKHGEMFDECYKIGVKSSPKFTGKVTVKATIGPTGKVNKADVVKVDREESAGRSLRGRYVREDAVPHAARRGHDRHHLSHRVQRRRDSCNPEESPGRARPGSSWSGVRSLAELPGPLGGAYRRRATMNELGRRGPGRELARRPRRA